MTEAELHEKVDMMHYLGRHPHNEYIYTAPIITIGTMQYRSILMRT